MSYLELLCELGGLSVEGYSSHPVIKAMYSNRSYPTQRRDINKMTALKLIKFSGSEDKDKIPLMKPNYQVLEGFSYKY